MHQLTVDEALQRLSASVGGLSQDEVKRRLQFYGPNELKEEKENKLKVFIRQFTSPFILILICAGFLAFFLGDLKDAIVIFGLVLANGLIGFYQELKALASVEALRKLAQAKVRVLRDGREVEVDVRELVPGDVVLLGEGDVVPADLRLISATGLMVDEALLTGESIPAEKIAQVVLKEDTPIHARKNLVFKGTTVVKGKAIALVYATGENTEVGKIAKKMQEKSPESPLIKALGALGKRWVIILVFLLSVLVLIGIHQGREAKTIVFFAIAQLVSAVPEGFPIVVTITLVIGAIRLSRENVLAKYLPSVETLGSATFICSDKTGTITTGKLKVADYVTIDEEKFILACALCNDAELVDGEGKGDPLEVSLLEWLKDKEVDYRVLREEYPRVWEEPFDTKKRFMATAVIAKEGGIDFYIKGSFESLSKMCEGECPTEFFAIHDSLAKKGLRVLAFGYARLKDVPKNVDEIRFQILGLMGFLDPPKEGVKEAILQAKKAGIKVIMITGDNLLTARAVAEMVSLHSKNDLTIEGKDLAKYNDDELYEVLKRVSVVARAVPDDKYRIVKVLQSKKEIVVVTGDGVNDVPALKVADLGIAMGSGSQAAKDAAKMIITDNNLAIIVNAIKRGRLIAKNISKVIRYLFSTSVFEVLYNSLAIIMGLPLPLYATQILWINLVTDGAQDKAYPFTKYEGEPMKEKPKKPEKVFLGKEQMFKIVYNGLFMAFSHFFLFKYLVNIYPYEVALTISFTSAAVTQWAVGIQEIGEKPFFKNPVQYMQLNPYIYLGVLIGGLLQLMAIYAIPHYFHAVILGIRELLYVMFIPVLTFIAIEIRKWFFLRHDLK
ncbi:cation-transporting P-type ATPase [Thermodesulfobacterium sp. TA1]|uniref:cation-translocating P-type ATPase n=1 Tax=Thermodesulfobacterium sp. TA1 TaxID=2234087 RepID=UPI001232A167|nr:cation-transporting P-type ATPase [Thermodesulfobacterium sp. TA1]QER41926.1 cation-transporting P-type ATPase [Thermodesulfobacterium sp. TA1]